MLLINLKSQRLTSLHAQTVSGVHSGSGKGQGGVDGGGGAHIKDVEVVVNQVLHDLHLMLSLTVCLKKAGSEEQCQVLGTHLVQVGTLLNPERCKGPAGRVQLGLGVLTRNLDKV